MPSTVESILGEVGLNLDGKAKWGEHIDEKSPGVYIVALSSEVDALDCVEIPKISEESIRTWIDNTPGMTIDLREPEVTFLVERLRDYWIPDETILYIGKTERNLSKRLKEFYRHKLGKRSPHKGGDWLKTLENLNDLNIYYSATDEAEKYEKLLMNAFGSRMTKNLDNSRIYEVAVPFANKESYRSNRKRHGLKNTSV